MIRIIYASETFAIPPSLRYNSPMKQSIHPPYYHDAQVTCSCGNTFTTGSTKKEIKVEICSACHPFFTGEMKFIDTMGRVEKFKHAREHAQTLAKQKKTTKIIEKKQERPSTLREMMLREKHRLQKTETTSPQKK